jgi:hypothetical protein
VIFVVFFVFVVSFVPTAVGLVTAGKREAQGRTTDLRSVG